MKRRKWKNGATVGLALGGLILVITSACGSDSSDSSDSSDGVGPNAAAALGGKDNADKFDELYKKAVDAGETEVVIYDSHAEETQSVYDLFTKRFPKIKITPVPVGGPEMEERIEAEFGSGQHVADVVGTGFTSAGKYSASGEFISYRPFTRDDDADDAYFGPEDRTFASGLSPMGIAYNKDKVDEKDLPSSWTDLVDPKWKGKIAIQDASVASGANGTFAQLIHDGKYGVEWAKQYAALEPRVESSGSAAANDVANGLVELAGPIQFNYIKVLQDSGANIGYVFPMEDKNYFVPHYVGILKGAPHEDAAKLFMSWILTPEAAEEAASIGYYLPLKSAKAPEGMPPLSEIDVANGLPFSQYEDYSTYTDQVKEVFGG